MKKKKTASTVNEEEKKLLLLLVNSIRLNVFYIWPIQSDGQYSY